MPSAKQDFPVEEVRHFLEPGPVVLISSRHGGRSNIMTLGWHSVLEFSPSLVSCMISSGNHSFDLIRASGECVINLPTADMVDTVAGIGNCSGVHVDKFKQFGMTPLPALRVGAPLIAECHANFECRVYDDVLVDRYNVFIFEVIKAHVAQHPAQPRTLHYTGNGVFMISGERIDRRKLFTKVL